MSAGKGKPDGNAKQTDPGDPANRVSEECRGAAARSQLLVTTHSPFFVNGLRPGELWVLYRNEKGSTRARRSPDMEGVEEFVNYGAKLGHLGMECYFEVGDPHINSGGEKGKPRLSLKPSRRAKTKSRQP